jgi:membrane protease YdiL (CAAX protease family)
MVAALFYLAGIAAAEVVTAKVSTVGGIVFHTILLFCLIVHSSFSQRPIYRFYLALAVAPLVRIVGLAMPLLEFDEAYWFLIVAIPLSVAVLVVIRILRLQRRDVGATFQRLGLQGLVALTGLGFGWVEYHILEPAPLIPDPSMTETVLLSIMLLICGGFIEELAFRGVLQHCAEEALGRWGWVYVAGLYSLLYIGFLSAPQWLFILLVGLFFGWVVRRTGSILGVAVSHGIANIVLYVVLPSLGT